MNEILVHTEKLQRKEDLHCVYVLVRIRLHCEHTEKLQTTLPEQLTLVRIGEDQIRQRLIESCRQCSQMEVGYRYRYCGCHCWYIGVV